MRGAGLSVLVLCAALMGCAYRGGKVVDGANLAIGMTIPGTEWSINALDYVGGVRVAGQDSTRITVANEVAETNDYFGVVTTRRKTRMSATIEPIPPACADGAEQGADGTGSAATSPSGAACADGSCTPGGAVE